MKENTVPVIEALREVANDNTIPKNIREKLQHIVSNLKKDSERSLKIDKALHDIETISDDSNLQAYTRTQLWNVVSMLETIK